MQVLAFAYDKISTMNDDDVFVLFIVDGILTTTVYISRNIICLKNLRDTIYVFLFLSRKLSHLVKYYFVLYLIIRMIKFNFENK